MNHRLFTINNPKTVKGEAAGWLTAILHLAPERSSGIMNVCPNASPGCVRLCLNTAGRGGIVFKSGDNPIMVARKRRVAEYHENKAEFVRKLVEEIEHWSRYAHNQGLKLAVRINGTSDLPGLARQVHKRAWHLARFYDYTKVFTAFDMNPGIDYTFSRSERNELECSLALSTGTNVAVVFSTKKGEALPKRWLILGLDYRVVDGDKSDLRFLDPKGDDGIIIGLRAKGRARTDAGEGFVVQV